MEKVKEKTKVKSNPKTKILDKSVISRCHSFWHRECENRDKECYRCDKWY